MIDLFVHKQVSVMTSATVTLGTQKNYYDVFYIFENWAINRRLCHLNFAKMCAFYFQFQIIHNCQLTTVSWLGQLHNQSTMNLMHIYKTVIRIHGHSNTNTRELCTDHYHFSFGIYLQTKRTANEMQGRLSTLLSKKSAYSRLSLYAAYYDGFSV